MYIILKKLGFKPILISLKTNINLYFLRKYLNLMEIKNYSELKEKDFDILIANSDQIWNYKNGKRMLEYGFLSFADNWNISKFVYAASLGHDYWYPSKEVLNSAKKLVKHLSGISVREQSSIEIIKKNLGIKPNFVLDPTFLLDKTDYLTLIKYYKPDIDLKYKYLCVYNLDDSKFLNNYINEVNKELKYKILYIKNFGNNYIERFIFSINICRALITDSFHGTVFSIIFSKPFITFINIRRGNARFISLNKTFELYNRIIYPKQFENNDIILLKTIPKINTTNFHILRKQSFDFLKKNLGLIKD